MKKRRFYVDIPPVVRGLEHKVPVVNAPDGKRVQVFVFSSRSGLWYPQATPKGDTATVVLGDPEHTTGTYRVVAVALEGTPKWSPVKSLPLGAVSTISKVRRLRK